jgi:hypothetical protein
VTNRASARAHVCGIGNKIGDLGVPLAKGGGGDSSLRPQMQIAPPEKHGLSIKQETAQDTGSRTNYIGVSNCLPTPALVAEDRFPTSVQELEAHENLSVFEMIERFKVEDNGAAVKAPQQTNPLRKPAYSKPAMGELLDFRPRVAAGYEIKRGFRISRPDTQISNITFYHRYIFASGRMCA